MKAFQKVGGKPIEELLLSEAVCKRLRGTSIEIETIDDLVKKSRDEIAAIKGIGRPSLNEIEWALDNVGLCLGMGPLGTASINVAGILQETADILDGVIADEYADSAVEIARDHIKVLARLLWGIDL